MIELEKKLTMIPGAYNAFVHGITKHATKKPERYKTIMKYVDEHPEATPSDIIEFVSSQPDFFDDKQLAQM